MTMNVLEHPKIYDVTANKRNNKFRDNDADIIIIIQSLFASNGKI